MFLKSFLISGAWLIVIGSLAFTNQCLCIFSLTNILLKCRKTIFIFVAITVKAHFNLLGLSITESIEFPFERLWCLISTSLRVFILWLLILHVQSRKPLLFYLFGLMLHTLQLGVWVASLFFPRHGVNLHLLRAQYSRFSVLSASTNTACTVICSPKETAERESLKRSACRRKAAWHRVNIPLVIITLAKRDHKSYDLHS